MKDEERLAAQHYSSLVEAISRDYHLTCPITILKTAVLGYERRTRLRFNSLFAIDEFMVSLSLKDASGQIQTAEIEFGIWESDGNLEVFESKLT